MKKLSSIPIILCLLLMAGCEKSEDVTYRQLQTKQTMLQERQAIISRALELKDAIQTKTLTPEKRTKEINSLVIEIEKWNARPGVRNNSLTATQNPKGPRRPRLPPQPCLLIPIHCEPITIINGSLCINTGQYCNRYGQNTCKYVCLSDLIY